MPVATIYIRFSHLDQKEGSSTVRQRQDCLRRCQDRGWDVASTFVDEGGGSAL